MRIFYLKKYLLLSALLFIPYLIFAQTGSITGKVVDENKQPLPGASVIIVGTTKGGATNVDGGFTITGVKPGTYTLEAKFVGYTPIQSAVTVANGKAVVNFNLKPDSKSLSEVVVIGYGTQTRKELTGAITTVTSKDFQKGTITSPEQLIAGKVAGVSITSAGGQPGAGSQIRIRQGASLNASNDPLIVIDGVPLAPSRNNSDNTSTISGVANPLSLINPDDIETFTVLKDAASTAIYGSRASNGVILITTKKGTTGKPKVEVSSQTSINTIAKRIQVLSADQVRSYIASYDAANGTNNAALLGKANTDWQDQIFQRALTSSSNVSISGSTYHTPYRVSIGYLDQDGTLRTDNIKRTTGALRLSPKFFNDDLKIDINLNGTYQKSRFANQGAIGSAISFNPTQPVYDASSVYDGYYESLGVSGVPNPNAPRNPVGLLNDYNSTADVYRSFGNGQINYRFPFLRALTANANFGYDVSKGNGTVYVPANAAQSYANLGNNTPYQGKVQNSTVEYFLNYNKDINSIKSNINATAGYGYYNYLTTTYNYQTLSANSAPAPNAAAPVYPYGQDEYTIISYYGRLIYTFDKKYIFAGTVRTDGSSKFVDANRWGFFPSAAFTWRISDENFLKDSKTLSDLKLRLSYGITGQQDGIKTYGYQSILSQSTNDSKYPFGNTYYNTYAFSYYDTSLRWEQTNTFNAGFDFGFLQQRITGSIDVYSRKTKNLLATVPIPAGTNFTNQLTTNVGNTTGSGVEFNLNAIAVKTKDITWSLNYNIAYNKTTITNLYLTPNATNVGAQVGTISGGTGNYIQINSINYSPNTFYVYQQVYGANGKPLEGVYVDQNHDGAITAADLVHYKSAIAPYIMGFSTQFSYKKWTASTVLRANIGNYVYNNEAANIGIQASLINNTGVVNNATTDIYNANFKTANYFSDYYVQNASFLKMDNVGVAYNFGKLFRNSAANLRVNANCQNVFTITKYTGLDPEALSGATPGIDNNAYPRSRIFTIGVNVGF
jgi:TonB-linked SusC/RagA family outer membrane protein